ncbi:MAG: molybdenum cofactor guanylyltransferase [Jaaginema sp. PMC 1079.18]|nr:molybdenum cofactor guanylyltransferase [Jaaginema sp. PMC 1080.18]MEC4849970.1 molybdenum cofactor guanylyltransferase [Jaaginema sp. PMC 1079.18]MEC4866935.1 molybdenum cofactor guanylyltransferase [Jaaginema sp. PMC 1078.18]
MTQSVTPLILAGGQSSRMGKDKASIKWQNVPLLRRVCDLALIFSDSVYILTPWPNSYDSLVPSGCYFLPELGLQQGPLSAFAEGITRLPSTDWVWLLACDLPRLEAKIMQNWLQFLADVPSEILAVVPYHDDYFEPLCGFYRPAIASYLRQFQAGGGRSFQRFLRQVPTQRLMLNEPEVLMLWNCNTPEDLNFSF